MIPDRAQSHRVVSFRKFSFFTTLRSLCVLCASTFILFFPSAAAEEHVSPSVVLDLKLDGEVEPILATYIDDGLADAARRHAALVLITMDTHGGLSDSMKDIIQHILSSPVPVAAYVSLRAPAVGPRDFSSCFPRTSPPWRRAPIPVRLRLSSALAHIPLRSMRRCEEKSPTMPQPSFAALPINAAETST